MELLRLEYPVFGCRWIVVNRGCARGFTNWHRAIAWGAMLARWLKREQDTNN